MANGTGAWKKKDFKIRDKETWGGHMVDGRMGVSTKKEELYIPYLVPQTAFITEEALSNRVDRMTQPVFLTGHPSASTMDA